MTFSVYAVKYATLQARKSQENFHGRDPHDSSAMPIDFFVWAAVSNEYTVVMDVGFTAEIGAQRGRTHLRCPTEGLKAIGIDADQVPYVVLTHLHYDHVGNMRKFPSAKFVIQDDEVAFWTGRYASRGEFHHIVEVEDVLHLVEQNFAGRVQFVNGSEEIVPGVSVHWVGGHSPGLQVVRVKTERGDIVLASDATHYYSNIGEDRPFSVVTDLRQMYGAFDIVRSLSETEENIIPGHDPSVMDRFPPAGEGLEGIAVQIA